MSVIPGHDRESIPSLVIPAQAGIHAFMDPRVREDDS